MLKVVEFEKVNSYMWLYVSGVDLFIGNILGIEIFNIVLYDYYNSCVG